VASNLNTSYARDGKQPVPYNGTAATVASFEEVKGGTPARDLCHQAMNAIVSNAKSRMELACVQASGIYSNSPSAQNFTTRVPINPNFP
jgi:hypothetical protein